MATATVKDTTFAPSEAPAVVSTKVDDDEAYAAVTVVDPKLLNETDGLLVIPSPKPVTTVVIVPPIASATELVN